MSHRIDWRRFFEQAAALLHKSRGGLMQVLGDESSARPLFAELLRIDLTASGWSTASLELGAQDGATFDELLATLMDRLGCKLEVQTGARIGADKIDAGGSVTFQNNSINVAADPYANAARRSIAKQAIRDSIEAKLADAGAFALFLTNESGAETLARGFWAELWPGFLDELTKKGLRIVEVVRGTVPSTSRLADCVIDLPSSFSQEDEAIAIEDMIAILASKVGPSEKLRVICRTVMVSAGRRPIEVHTLFHLNLLDQMREPL